MSINFRNRQNNIRRTVFEVLTEYPETRINDVELILKTLAKLGVDTSRSFIDLAYSGQLSCLESITRHRRALFARYPEFNIVSGRKRRKIKEQMMHEYFSHYEENLTV